MKSSSAVDASDAERRCGGRAEIGCVQAINARVADSGAAKPCPGRRQRFSGAVGASHRLPCGARPCGPSHNSLRSHAFATLRQGATSQITWRACARGPQSMCSSAPRRRAAAHPGAPLRFQRWFAHAHHPGWTSRQAVPGTGDLWGGEERRSGVGAQSALRRLTRRACPSAVSAANAASCAVRPQPEHRSGVGATRRAPHHEPRPGTACRDARDSLHWQLG
jgi:hypothetical protein